MVHLNATGIQNPSPNTGQLQGPAELNTVPLCLQVCFLQPPFLTDANYEGHLTNESRERTHLYRFARVLSSPMGFPNACPRDINSPSYPSYANSCSYQMKESIQDSMTTSHFVVIKDAM